MAKKTNGVYYKHSLLHDFVVAIFLIIFTAVWMYITSNMIRNKQEFIKSAQKTTALITNMETSIDRDKIYRVDIKYSVNGIEYTGILKETNTNMYEGMKLDIYYNVYNPNEFIQYSFFDRIAFSGFGYLVLLLAIVQLIYFIKKLIIYLITLKGKEIQSNVIGLKQGVYFGQRYFKIECEWKNERGVSYTFFSEKFTEPYFEKEFEKMNIKTLPVRIKDNNPAIYIVFTDKIHKKLDK